MTNDFISLMQMRGEDPKRNGPREGGPEQKDQTMPNKFNLRGEAHGHAEARRLLSKGFKLCALHKLSKRPMGNGWQLNPITVIDDQAGGYGMPLALNGMCSLDPDNLEPAREGLRRCGFDLEELMAAGVRTSSTRPGSGGRSTFRAPPGLGRIVFSSERHGTILELRAGQSNLQDCLPGTVYLGKNDDGPYTQDYANGKTFDDAPQLPAKFLAWWRRMDQDVEFKREQQTLLCGEGAVLSVSGGVGKGAKLAFQSGLRRDYNAEHSVEDILARHGYTTDGGGRWAPSTATGAACVRAIPGAEGLWQSDHASDPLCGTFDAWTAFVALDFGGSVTQANEYWSQIRNSQIALEFPIEVVQATDAAIEKAKRNPLTLDWSSLPEFPTDPKFVIPGWMPDGVVTLFAAHGGTGKSFLSVYIALCLATGRHPFEKGVEIERTKVVLYSAEDNMQVMQVRFARYMRILGIDVSELEGWLMVLDATESDNVLFTGDEKVNGRTTARFGWLAREIAQFDASVLIFDNASDAIDANENDRAKVRQFMSSLKRLASAVLLLAHVDAISSMADPSEAKGYSGSTAWHNSARSRWFMSRSKDKDDVVLTLPKVNYAKAGAEVVIRWSDELKVFEVVGTRQGRAKAADHRAVMLDLLNRAIMNGVLVSPSTNTSASVWNTIKDMDGCPSGLKSADVAKEVMRWRTDGIVTVESRKRHNRTLQDCLVLTDEGRKLCDGGAGAEDFA